MKKLLLILLCSISGITLYAAQNNKDISSTIDNVVKEDVEDDEFVMVPDKFSREDEIRMALVQAVNEVKKTTGEAVNKELDKFNRWMEKELPVVFEKVLTNLFEKTKSRADSIWEGTKSVWSKWFGSKKKEEVKPALIR